MAKARMCDRCGEFFEWNLRRADISKDYCAPTNKTLRGYDADSNYIPSVSKEEPIMKTKDKRPTPCITGPIELKAWLKVLNISQRKLGYECGVSQSMISCYVNRKPVSRDLEAKILNGANKMMLNYLFGVTLKVDAKDQALIVKAAEAMTDKMKRFGY